MDNLESSILDLVSGILELNKKREIRVADLNSLSRKAEELKGSFTFTKRLLTELSQEGTDSVEKLRSVRTELKEERESHQKCIEDYEEQVAILNADVEKKNNEINELSRENNELLKERNIIKVKLSNSEETCTLLREEMQKAQLTCTTYEEQIIRLNEQLSLETIEKQNKGDFYEKKVQDLEERVEIMEEGMYDPEAYYCLERDKCLETANRLEEEMQSVSLTSQKKDYLLAQKTQECERLTNEIDNLRSELQDFVEIKSRAEKMEYELADLMNKVEETDHLKKEVEELREKVNDKDKKNLLEDIATSNSLIADLNQSNNELKSQIERIELEKEKQEQIVANQRASIELNQEQVDRLSEKLDQCLHELDCVKAEYDLSSERVQQLEKSLEDKEKERVKEIADYQTRIQKLTEELALKDVSQFDLNDDSLLELEAELKKDENRIQELEAILKEMEGKQQEQQTEMNMLQQQLEQKRGINQQSDDQELKDHLHIVSLEKEELQNQIQLLQDQLKNEKEEHDSDFNNVIAEKNEMEEQLRAMQVEKEDLQNTNVLIRNQLTHERQEKVLLEQQLLEVNTLLKETGEERATLLQQIQVLQQADTDEVDQMKEQLQVYEETTRKNQEEQEAMKIKIQLYENKIAELQQLEERCNELEKDIQIVANQSTLDSKVMEHPTNSLIIDSLRKENEMLNKRVLELIVARETAEKSAYSLESTVNLLTNSLSLREKEIESLSRTIKDKSVLIGQLKSQLAVCNH